LVGEQVRVDPCIQMDKHLFFAADNDCLFEQSIEESKNSVDDGYAINPDQRFVFAHAETFTPDRITPDILCFFTDEFPS